MFGSHAINIKLRNEKNPEPNADGTFVDFYVIFIISFSSRSTSWHALERVTAWTTRGQQAALPLPSRSSAPPLLLQAAMFLSSPKSPPLLLGTPSLGASSRAALTLAGAGLPPPSDRGPPPPSGRGPHARISHAISQLCVHAARCDDEAERGDDGGGAGHGGGRHGVVQLQAWQQ